MNNIGRSFEECPLQQFSTHQCQKRRSQSYKGPLRVVRLCIFGIALPALFISLPLYLRYHVYSNQLYPFAVSDIRLLDRRISTVWCQRQIVKANATFNAFLLSNKPQVIPEPKPLSMVRELYLEDDMKEYWGFYLLNGSKITVSTCVRWPGASLIIIRGHKHLHECAYIGDDSSEEFEELWQIAKENKNASSSSENMSNVPSLMKRHRADVRFHDIQQDNARANFKIAHEELDISDVSDPKALKEILQILANKKNVKKKQNDLKIRHEKKKLNLTVSEEVFAEIAQKLDALGDRKHNVLAKLNTRLSKSSSERLKREVIIKSPVVTKLNLDDEENNVGVEEGFVSDELADHRGSINETTTNDRSFSEFWSSFSSSEEALLNCKGLILNLPLTPHHKCHKNETDETLNEASVTNTITYIVPQNGYYFFVFNSENEVQVNYIRLRFEVNKTTYDVSQSISSCSNITGECGLDLNFFSNQKTVLEVPVTINESRWNEEYVVISECQPRTIIYVVCVLAVPIFIIFFAFQ